MGEMAFGFLMQRMCPIRGNIFRLFKLRIQCIIHSCIAATDLHMQQAGNLTDKGLQFGCDQSYGSILIQALL